MWKTTALIDLSTIAAAVLARPLRLAAICHPARLRQLRVARGLAVPAAGVVVMALSVEMGKT